MKYLLLIILPLFSMMLSAKADHGDLDKNNPDVAKAINNVRIPWIQNDGQQPSEVAFYAKTFAGTVFVNHSGDLIYNLPVDSTRSYSFVESFVSGNELKVTPGTPSETKVNYFIGSDSDNWKTDISTFQSVNLGEPWEGIQVECKAYGNNIEKLFIVAPYADPSNIIVNIKGAKKLKISESGELIISTPAGETKFTKPIAYQIINDEKVFREVEYLVSKKSYSFKIIEYNPNFTLIIDPLLASTFIGGSGSDNSFDITIDSYHNVFITGTTTSLNFPITPDSYMSIMPGYIDIFISKFDPLLTTLLSSSYVGGSNEDLSKAISLDSENNIFILGMTTSSDYPVTLGAYDQTYNGSDDVFISKLNNDLDSLFASTYMGGNQADECNAITINSIDEIIITGHSPGGIEVTPGAYHSYTPYGRDAFISKLNNDLTLLINSTYLGGSQEEYSYCIALDNNENIIVSGSTLSLNFPTTPSCFDNLYNYIDVFISILSSDLSQLLASTYLGGQGGDKAKSILISSTNFIFVTGETSGTENNFPTTPGAYDQSPNGGHDIFISKLDSNLATLISSTFVGGSSLDNAISTLQSNNGDIYVGGWTQSPDFPITSGALDTTFNGYSDIFILKMDTSLSSLLKSSFIGGVQSDECNKIFFDSNQNIYLTGRSDSWDYPTTNDAFSQSNEGSMDAILSLIDKSLMVLPSIIIQPDNSEICEGDSTTFIINSDYTDFFQWQANEGAGFFDLSNNAVYQGVNTDSLQIIIAQINMNGFSYRCRVTNEAGVNFSDTVFLYVNETTEVILQPQNSFTCENNNTEFFLSAIGKNLTYQWYKDGNIIPDANSYLLVLNSVTFDDEGGYYCEVIGDCGNTISDTALLTVFHTTEILVDPNDTIACEGGEANFHITAIGANLEFQWRKDGINIQNTNDSVLIISSIIPSDSGLYDCIVTGECGTDISNAALLSIGNTELISQPSDITECENVDVSFSVSATGLNLTYQWRKDSEVISGANSAVLNLYSIDLNDQGDYDCLVTGDCDSQTSEPATLIVHPLTVINLHPTPDSICEGENSTFTVETAGYNLSFLWYKNGIQISGATNPSYQILNATINDSGFYSCQVSGECGVLMSNSANLIVYETTEITLNLPAQVIACEGDNTMFTIEAIGQDLTYQWRKDGVNIEGSNNFFNLTDITLADQGLYDCVISGTCGTVTSNATNFIIHEITEVITQPINASVCEGGVTTFEIEAVGFDLSYQWRKFGSDIPGATDTILTITNAQLSDAGTYTCVVFGYCNEILSEAALLEVWQTTEIITQPVNSIICENEDAQFSVASNGYNLTYQWRKNGNEITGETNSVFNLNEATLNDIGNYDCIVTGDCGIVNSIPASLYVIELVGFIVHPNSATIESGEIALFNVACSGVINQYKWRQDGEYLSDGDNISGSSSVELIITNVDFEDTGVYDCEITGECNTEVSEPANLAILGINTIQSGNIKIFPNPTTGLLNILSESSNRIEKAIITNQLGTIVFSRTDLDLETEVDLSGFSKGIYLIELQTAEGVYFSKIYLN